ncbi:MAG: CDGSH iron-sulfur domain-containing protein [Pseudomonadota bacterium]
MTETNPTIAPAKNGPLLVKHLTRFRDAKGAEIAAKETMALCRCGQSANKPFCDGTHAKVGFSDDKSSERVPDRRDDYVGAAITIHDNRGACAHAGICTDQLKSVWRMGVEPWIDPDGAAVEAIVETIRQCPSGALSYTLERVEHRDLEGPPAIQVTKDGPYHVSGGVALSTEPWSEGCSREHYALCRCGHSKNKPFCDGSHWAAEFTDPGTK